MTDTDKHARVNDARPGTSSVPGVASQSDSGVSPAASPQAGGPGLALVQPGPQQVEVWPYYDVTLEPLAVQLQPQNAQGTVKYTATVDAGTASVAGSVLTYAPTSTDAQGNFNDNAGAHTIKVTATDSTGASATVAVAVNVLETSFTYDGAPEADGSTGVRTTIVSPMHPNWHLTAKQLVTTRCIPALESADGNLQLASSPGPIQVTAPTQVAGGTQYSFSEDALNPSSSPYKRFNVFYYDDIVVDDPTGVVKHFESHISNSTCIGPSGESSDDCAKKALNDDGAAGLWYCSDYIDSSDTLATMAAGTACDLFDYYSMTEPRACSQ